MKVAGLTGGMGSGKTTVAGFFTQLNVPVYIADDAGKHLMNTSAEVRAHIIDLLGKEAYTEEGPDRKYIATRVFNSEEKLQKLNNIIHPAVGAHFEKWKQQQKSPYVIYEAAILLEQGGEKKCDWVILVTASHEQKVERLLQRDQSKIDEIQARMKHQWSDEKKRLLADFEIKNEELESTKEQVRKIHDFLLKATKK